MANTHEPLLASTDRKTNTACKILLVSLISLAALACLTALITVHVTTTHQLRFHQPSDLCTSSPNPTSCRAIVSDALTAGNSPQPSTVQVLQTIIRKSALRLDPAVTVAGDMHRRTNDPSHQAALADCMHLMDLSRDRLVGAASAVASGSHDDARAWLSAVLTNHDTCLGGLSGGGGAAMEAHLKFLMELASASLAVLTTVSPAAADDYVVEPVLIKKFPSWVGSRDRRLLEAPPTNAVEANVVVAKDGSGKYKTVQEAVNSAPNGGKSRYVIYVKRGVYKENVNLGKQKTNIMIVGDGMAATIITGSLNVVDGSTTFNSATLAVAGDGFILQDICIQNTAGPEKHQAVALRVSADRSVINRCNIEAYQDTLYTHTLRQFYRDSTVSGTVDFVFGNAAVVLQNCELVARKPMRNQQNLVTAQGRIDPNQNTGTSIQNCRIVPGADLAPAIGSIPTYLGRPWKEYSRTVVMQSYIGGHVAAKGWLEWSGDFALRTLFYGEYENRGPGAGTGGRVKWPGYKVITDRNLAGAFTVASLIQGGTWLKPTGVAFTEGL